MIKNWLYALAIAIILSCSYMLDGHAFEPKYFHFDTKPDKIEAYQACKKIGGPNAWFVVTDSGKIVCVNKRGNKLSEQPK
jgi:hypothetical protein